jgi:phenylacetate-CoA ligase
MTKHHLTEYSLDTSDALLSTARQPGGHLVASGGTTAAPKYIFYDHAELAIVIKNLAMHFSANGMATGDSVVNYLSSGDMWSSFVLVDNVLTTLPVTIIPLGCSHRIDYSLEILQKFTPNVIVGIPSMILDLARYCAKHQRKPIGVEKVFYAGEQMFPAMMDELRAVWRCQHIRSAGYASTDVGSIGWQCLHCNTDEHHAFDDTVVEIIDGELVVTSLTRRSMPMIRYCTGDRAEWVSPPCDCGKGAPIFKLLGRLDNVVLIWGCRILYDEIVAVFQEMREGTTAIQLRVHAVDKEHFLRVDFESPNPLDVKGERQLRDRIYQRCGDLHGAVQREELDRLFLFEPVPAGTLERNQRTGKLRPIMDLRS